MKLKNYYHIHQYPFVGVLDPRTGELMARFKGKLDSTSFCEKVMDFLSDHSLPIAEFDESLNSNSSDINDITPTDVNTFKTIDNDNDEIVIVDDQSNSKALNGHHHHHHRSNKHHTNGYREMNRESKLTPLYSPKKVFKKKASQIEVDDIVCTDDIIIGSSGDDSNDSKSNEITNTKVPTTSIVTKDDDFELDPLVKLTSEEKNKLTKFETKDDNKKGTLFLFI
jgi:hypothetical protein